MQFLSVFVNIRPWLVKSWVIVIYFFEIEMRDAVIINNLLLLYSYSTGKSGVEGHLFESRQLEDIINERPNINLFYA